jgi:hypothetical protein
MISLWKLLTLAVDLCTFWGGSSGGGGGSQETKSVTTNLPEYAQPFYEELLKQSGKQIYQTDASGAVTGVKEFQPYTGQRVAGFSPEQQAVQTEVAGMTTPGAFQTASGTLGTVGSQAGTAAQQGLTQALAYQPGHNYSTTSTNGSIYSARRCSKLHGPLYTSGGRCTKT